MAYLLLIVLLGLGNKDINYVTARLERRIKATRVSQQITIDGKLTESAWAEAPKASNFIQSEPREGEPSAERTEVRVLYDKDNLYCGIYAYDSKAGNLVISDLKKDFGPESSDVFELVLDTFRDERNGYLFSINAAGAKRDAQMINEGREVNASWDGVWYVKTTVADDGWIAEIAIPFKSLKFRESAVQTWGLNFHRGLRSNVRNEDSYWSPLPRIYNLQRVSLAGTLEDLEDIRPGSNIRIKPYAASSVAQNGVSNLKKGDADAGFDVKYGVTSGLAWDFTYNTDFSQVEADE
ncbi:MAG: carbohydrate binding family 9 domain-containing protein, partial [Acidobacteria bacterium]|nr:carbohydrate binding family 9 domain-containing protein [Acidobacteriota bacterium]